MDHAGGTDTDVTDQVLSQMRSDGHPVTAVWQPAPTVSFGPRDRRHDGYAAAVSAAQCRGFAPIERTMGGRPVAMHEGCLALVVGFPPTDSIEERYQVVVDAVAGVIRKAGIDVQQQCVTATFCPGRHSLVSDGKIAGVAQRVRQHGAAVGGIIIVRNHAPLAEVLDRVYDHLDLAFDPETVGSLHRSGLDRPASVLADDIKAALDAAVASWYRR